jgi:putative endonuclease
MWPFTRRPLTRRELGALGERHAARLLRAKGLRVLEANFRTRFGEIDLIARDGDTVVYVEVRTRTREGSYRTPLESVDAEKQRRILRTARRYRTVRRLGERPGRFDVVEVIATPEGRVLDVRHFPGAFIEGL